MRCGSSASPPAGQNNLSAENAKPCGKQGAAAVAEQGPLPTVQHTVAQSRKNDKGSKHPRKVTSSRVRRGYLLQPLALEGVRQPGVTISERIATAECVRSLGMSGFPAKTRNCGKSSALPLRECHKGVLAQRHSSKQFLPTIDQRREGRLLTRPRHTDRLEHGIASGA